MKQRIAKILLSGFLTLLFLLCLTFVLSRWVPIDPTLSLIGDTASGDSYQQARERLGVDLPIRKQMLLYFHNLLHGDLGSSLMTSRPVAEDLLKVFPATLELAVFALLIGMVGGIPIGVMAAWRPRSFWNTFVQMQVVIYSVPTFVLSILALLIFYVTLQWAEGPGKIDILYSDIPSRTGSLLLDSALNRDGAVFSNAFRHLLLPAGILGFFNMASLSRMTRSLMSEQLQQPYIMTATLKGLSPSRILWRHAFRNIYLPLATLLIMSFASLLEGAVIIETIFAWPGLGSYLTQSVMTLDTHAFLGATLLVGILFIGFNVITDILSILIDPRGTP